MRDKFEVFEGHQMKLRAEKIRMLKYHEKKIIQLKEKIIEEFQVSL
jgi:hypothetical protein